MGAKRLVSRLIAFVNSQDGDFQDWCCGRAEDVESSLFAHHNVDASRHPCLVEPASSAGEAQEALRLMLQMGFHPGHDEISDRSTYVFVYRIDSSTSE